MLDDTLLGIKKKLPNNFFKKLQPAYHYMMAFLSALYYRFPSRKIIVVAVTGTKGKTSVTEIVSSMLEEVGFKTAVSNTIRFKIGDDSKENLYKMSMPGRFFIQRFLRKAVRAKCDYAIVEATSQGAVLYRHKFIELDALIFTNLAPEHIESHGSYEQYVEAKLSIARALAHSKKKRKILVANTDDKEAHKFLAMNVSEKKPYRLTDANPYKVYDEGLDFTFRGTKIHSPLSGVFNIMNILGAATFAETQNVDVKTIKKAVEKFSGIPGRVERIHEGQDFEVVVDYAHTPDSLQKLYDVFQNRRRICVLGNTGGGRDVWKRDEMAKIAERECDEIILTNEDPYDDNPKKILEDMAVAIPESQPYIIMDRREAIAKALTLAKEGDAVLITGKGTDPYIMGANGSRIPWSDAKVAREELRKIM
ncbi:MAG TPA: UDP-N-acetylmuramyl-tripeptide synthetase [Candidatus Paceibacterota bacterium]|nr:UDP-N-acetylmuramyl-tripeptide synthetase [Candidatus Paceibacterota bacterium]